LGKRALADIAFTRRPQVNSCAVAGERETFGIHGEQARARQRSSGSFIAVDPDGNPIMVDQHV